MNWNKGDIIKGRKGSDAIHPIIFFQGYDDAYFIGAMITHLNKEGCNILLSKNFFAENDLRGNRYEVQFEETYLVKAKLLKRLDWGPFRKVGELTNEGIEYLDSIIKEKYPEIWEESVANFRSINY